jgi:MFS family permease
LDEHNPYQTPSDVVTNSSPDGIVRHRAGALTYTAWIFIFAINMAVPLLFSLALTDQHGRLGMSAAALFLFTLGCLICAANRKLAVALLAGGALVALTQLVPGLQIIAGMIGIGVGQTLGHATFDSDDHPARITSEFGGFIVTFITGGILMAGSICAGILLQFVTRFFGRANR